jgi:hypothetical protein
MTGLIYAYERSLKLLAEEGRFWPVLVMVPRADLIWDGEKKSADQYYPPTEQYVYGIWGDAGIVTILRIQEFRRLRQPSPTECRSVRLREDGTPPEPTGGAGRRLPQRVGRKPSRRGGTL